MADPRPYPGAPRWVKVSGVIGIILVLLVLIMLLTGVGGPHGPGRHSVGSTESIGAAPPDNGSR